MSTNYPGALDTTAQLKNDANDATTTATTHSVAHNNIADSIIAIEAELGVNPSGANFSTVAAFLSALDSGAVKLAPSVDQIISPTADKIALVIKAGNLNISNLSEWRLSTNAIVAFVNKDGIFSAQGLQINGTSLAIQHLSDGKQIQKKDQFASFTRVEGVTPGLTGNPQTALQVSASSTWNLSIAAGAALIQGDDNTAQGMYAVTQGTSFTLALPTHAPVGNPRVDAICIRYNDSLYTARTPADTFEFIQVVGTPTASASLANLNGKPSIPNSTLLLAYILVAPTDSGVAPGNVLDQRILEGPAIWGEDGHRYRLGIDANGQPFFGQVA